MGSIHELINKHISKGLYKNALPKKNKKQKKRERETDYCPKAVGLLVNKQTNKKKKNDSEKFQTVTSLEGNKTVQ